MRVKLFYENLCAKNVVLAQDENLRNSRIE